jgi:hypothetical protein
MSLLALALSLTLAGAPCRGERVVLVPFQAVALSAAEARQVEDTVRRAAEATPGLCLEPRAETVAKMRARGGRLPGCLDAACRGAQVLALGAERLMRGVALGVGGGRSVALTLVNREGLEAHATVALSGEALAQGAEAAHAREAVGALWAKQPGGGVKRAGTPWPTVLVASGGAALATGVGFGLAARRTETALSSGTGGCGGEGEAFRACFARRLREGQQQAFTANVLLGAGALLAAGGAAMFVWEFP